MEISRVTASGKSLFLSLLMLELEAPVTPAGWEKGEKSKWLRWEASLMMFLILPILLVINSLYGG